MALKFGRRWSPRAGGIAVAVMAAVGALFCGDPPAQAQMSAIPHDAVVLIQDGARQANLGYAYYGMAGFDTTNAVLASIINEARGRAAGSIMGLAAVTAVERYPVLLPQIVRATVEIAPGHRDAIARQVALVFPLRAEQIYAAAGTGPLPPGQLPAVPAIPPQGAFGPEPSWTAIPATIYEPVAVVSAPPPEPIAPVTVPTAPAAIPELPGATPEPIP